MALLRKRRGLGQRALAELIGINQPTVVQLERFNTGRLSTLDSAHYTFDDDGLSLPWHGVVFLNPPYGRTIGQWIANAKAEVFSGNAKLALALIPARTDTTWWHNGVAGSATVFFLRGRLSFVDVGQSAPFRSARVLWGGTVSLPVSTTGWSGALIPQGGTFGFCPLYSEFRMPGRCRSGYWLKLAQAEPPIKYNRPLCEKAGFSLPHQGRFVLAQVRLHSHWPK